MNIGEGSKNFTTSKYDLSKKSKFQPILRSEGRCSHIPEPRQESLRLLQQCPPGKSSMNMCGMTFLNSKEGPEPSLGSG